MTLEQVKPATGSAVPRGGSALVSRRVALDLVAILEALALIASYAVACLASGRSDQAWTGWIGVLQVGLVAAIVVEVCHRSWGMYETRSVGNLPINPLRIAGALLLACVAIVGLGLPIPTTRANLPSWLLVWLGLAFVSVLVVRSISAHFLSRMTKAGRFDLRVAVFGSGAVARQVRDHLQESGNGITFVGSFDDRVQSLRHDDGGVGVNGSLNDLVAVGLADGVDQIIIALPPAASARIEQIARQLEHLPVSLHVVTHMASDLIVSGPAHNVSALGPIGLLDVKHKPLSDWSPIVKRTFDVVIAGALTVVALPLFCLIALAIKLEDGGPVIFIQRRRGLNQRAIPVLKFRSMRVMQDGAVVPQATRHDPRITRVGRFLRRSSLDELPQLFNVLRGDMSLVGPRPHALAHDLYYGGILEGYVNRHQVKPGITGLAQVRGLRGETRTDDKMQSRIDTDIEYISSWSPWLDLKILVWTIAAVLRGGNAH